MSSIKSSWAPTLMALAACATLPLAATAATVVRDADTGQLRAPNAEEARALRAPAPSAARTLRAAPATATAAPEAAQRVLPSGAVAAELDESTYMYSVARRNADGSVSRECVRGEDTAQQLLKKPASFTKPIAANKVARTARGAIYEDK